MLLAKVDRRIVCEETHRPDLDACFATGMSGQSGRGTWWNARVNHATTSVLPIARLAAVSPDESALQVDRAVVSGLKQSAGDYLPADELSPYCFRACAFA